jgi:hypothetical protein
MSLAALSQRVLDKVREQQSWDVLDNEQRLYEVLELMHDRCASAHAMCTNLCYRCITRNLRAAGLGSNCEETEEVNVYGRLNINAIMRDNGEPLLFAILNRVHGTERIVSVHKHGSAALLYRRATCPCW